VSEEELKLQALNFAMATNPPDVENLLREATKIYKWLVEEN